MIVRTDIDPAGRVLEARNGHCIDPRADRTQIPQDLDYLPTCPDSMIGLQSEAAVAGAAQVPITPGRELPVETLWNAWSDVRVTGIGDRRNDLDLNSTAYSATFGADRRISDNTVLGAMIGFQAGDSNGFSGSIETSNRGFTIGGYAASRLTENWSADATLGYGLSSIDTDILMFSGDYLSHQFFANGSLRGQYVFDDVLIRPEASISFSHVTSGDYDLSGTVFGRAATISLAGDDYNTGIFEARTEFSKPIVSQDMIFTPFAEFGVQVDFARPNGGEILTGNLTYATSQRVRGTARAGFRTNIGDNVFLEASAGYLSIGEQDFDIVEGGVFFSIGF